MWQELGIEPTVDPAAIRRAYAARLKAIDADLDPGAFRTLRGAFESAIARAARPLPHPMPRVSAEGDAKPEKEPRTEPLLISAIPHHERTLEEAESESARVREQVRRDTAAQKFEAAASHLVSASARGLLPLSDEEEVAAEVMTGVMADPKLPPERFREIAKQLHWDGPVRWDSTPHDTLRQQVRERLEAEVWYAEIVEQAARHNPDFNLRDRIWGNPWHAEKTAAMMLLGKAPIWRARFYKRWLQPMVIQYDRHQPWLKDRIDPAHVDWLRNATRPSRPAQKKTSNRRLVWLIIFIVVILRLVASALLGQ